ncbi:MAG: lysophospholipid acyltransferase family protein [Candidatus Hydrogenedentes bacterium]|nr:lysophospholipid acyltransferase family protein [Candidatus Hydrogenedentota bacterium]
MEKKSLFRFRMLEALIIKRLKRRVLALVSIALLNFVRLLGFRLARRVGVVLAFLAYYLVPRVKKIGMKNLNIAFGDSFDKQRKKEILWKAVKNMCLVAVEFPYMPYLASIRYRGVADYEGIEHIEEYIEGKKGAIFIGAHLGNWEMMASLMCSHGYRVVEVVRNFDDPIMDRKIDEIRNNSMIKTISKDSSSNEIIKLIKEGWFVGILVDQSPRDNAVPVKFFGRECWATMGPVFLHLRTGAPIHPVLMIRKEDGSFLLRILPALNLERTGNLRRDLLHNTQICQDAIESLVRDYPEQWLWFHDRWKPRDQLRLRWERFKDG